MVTFLSREIDMTVDSSELNFILNYSINSEDLETSSSEMEV